MKKFLLSIFLVAVSMITAYSQTAMTSANTVDSTTAGYVKCTVAGGAGNLTIHTIITKLANGQGGTVVGYAILQGSTDDTNYVNVKTWKTIPANAYGKAVGPFNLWDVDTFTLADVATAQPYAWVVTSDPMDIHPFLYYRVKVVMTTTKVNARGKYIFRKRI